MTYQKIDKLIESINKFKVEPEFSTEVKLRVNRKTFDTLTESEITEIIIKIIAFSQNANSKAVGSIIEKGVLSEVFADFNINEIMKMNPCDLADKYWDRISGIRQQAKLFHIVSLSRKIKQIGSFDKLLKNNNIPKKITNRKDIDQFWKGFKSLKKEMNDNKIPFLRSTTSLLHFLLETGHDCIKPDLVIMKVAKKIGIVDKETGEQNLIKTVKTVQQYSVDKKIKPSVVDLYFLIDEGQLGATKYVEEEFYKLPT